MVGKRMGNSCSSELLEIEKQIIQIELERSRLSREKGMVLLNKSVFLYFSFMFIGVLGFLNGYINSTILNYIIIMGLIALVVGTMPYVIAAHKEQKNLTSILEELFEKMEKDSKKADKKAKAKKKTTKKKIRKRKVKKR